MVKRDRYTIEIYYSDALIECITIITDNYPLVYRLASLYHDNDVNCTMCLVLWKGTILAAITDGARLDNVQQIPPSL